MADLQNTLGDLSQVKRVKMTKSVTLKWKWKNSIYKVETSRREDETRYRVWHKAVSVISKLLARAETQGNTFAVVAIRAYYTLEHSDDILKIDIDPITKTEY